MIKNEDYKIGSIVVLRKPHPSGTIEWEVVRLGADIKIKSTISNGLFLMFTRREFNRNVKEVIK